MKSANVSGRLIEGRIRRNFLAFRESGGKGAYPERLKNLCVEALQTGLTHQVVANCAEVSRGTIYQWEKSLSLESPPKKPTTEGKGVVQVLEVIKPHQVPLGSIQISIGNFKIEILARGDR